MTILVAYAPRPEGEAALEKGIEAATRRNERLIVVNAAVGGPQEDPNIVSGHDAERLVPVSYTHLTLPAICSV